MNQDITVHELKERLDNGEQVNLIDVRERWEYEENNIKGKLIPLGELISSIDELMEWKDRELIVHCRSGQRSSAACDYLRKQGFANVRSLVGGMMAWEEFCASANNR